MSKARNQGTSFETWIVTWLKGLRSTETAYRLAEGGLHDEGDIRFVDELNREWTIEAKARERLAVPQELAKARRKSGSPLHTVLMWKRLTLKDGNARRTPAGEPVVVCMAMDTFENLLNRRN
jgi:hypothetical protein